MEPFRYRVSIFRRRKTAATRLRRRGSTGRGNVLGGHDVSVSEFEPLFKILNFTHAHALYRPKVICVSIATMRHEKQNGLPTRKIDVGVIRGARKHIITVSIVPCRLPHRLPQAVQLESWPAQPLKQAPSSLSLAEQPTKSPRAPAVTQCFGPKPKFLQQLESYLQKELRLLACPPSGPHELRLQVSCDGHMKTA